jgi:hypothetical protein
VFLGNFQNPTQEEVIKQKIFVTEMKA